MPLTIAGCDERPCCHLWGEELGLILGRPFYCNGISLTVREGNFAVKGITACIPVFVRVEYMVHVYSLTTQARILQTIPCNRFFPVFNVSDPHTGLGKLL